MGQCIGKRGRGLRGTGKDNVGVQEEEGSRRQETSSRREEKEEEWEMNLLDREMDPQPVDAVEKGIASAAIMLNGSEGETSSQEALGFLCEEIYVAIPGTYTVDSPVFRLSQCTLADLSDMRNEVAWYSDCTHHFCPPTFS